MGTKMFFLLSSSFMAIGTHTTSLCRRMFKRAHLFFFFLRHDTWMTRQVCLVPVSVFSDRIHATRSDSGQSRSVINSSVSFSCKF
uniref:Secreted protein n=1 Tax=Rhipicephalus appendiculatus TaxID=34631 RepID=A0A131Z1U1_RHIAP